MDGTFYANFIGISESKVVMKKIREIVVACYVIAALYTPFIGYVRELHAHRAGNTSFLDLELLEQAVIVALIAAPAWCLSFLKIGGRPEEPIA